MEARIAGAMCIGSLMLACDPHAPPDLPADLTTPTPIDVSGLVDADCIGCHRDAAATWRDSAHRTAFTDEVFQAEWAPTEQAACVRCHAPLADPEAPHSALGELGVSCVTCHVRDGVVLSVHASPNATHAVLEDPSLGTESACAGCHDFPFASVAPTPHDLDAPLQRTLHEWREVSGRGTCQRCHARDAEGHVTHAMVGARDPVMLARALEVEASATRRDRGTVVRLVLRSRAGHAVPTGDMYRRLEVSAWSPDERVSQVLMRRFERIDGVLREVEDTRVPASGEREVLLELGTSAGEVQWRIEWQALEPALAAQRWIPEDDVRRVLAEGVLEVPE